ncbi:hypothetical protein ACLQ29_18070 [Micromonospora sp. DT228]|uniref:hypothetical protein n=1 Tax=Micromonospora sp. DT228 TaxID=3393443 RepID=UPI003CF5F180
MDAGEVVSPVDRQRIRPGATRNGTAVPLRRAEITTDRDQITVGRVGGDARLADLPEGAGTQHAGFGALHRMAAGSILSFMTT